MKVIILAGGKGTRLGKISENIPKPMVPVLGKPLLEYQIELCRKYGLRDITLIINHLGNHIVDYFGDGAPWDVQISYYEEAEPLGTVGGIAEIADQLQQADFMVLYGDVMMEMDLQRLINFHRDRQSEATLVVHPNDHPYDSDLLEMDDQDKIVRFHPKPHPSGMRYHNLVNAAVYIFSPLVLNYLQKGQKADFGKDIFPSLCQKIEMYGYNTPEYVKDMGTPQRLQEVERALQSGKIMRKSLSLPQRAIFLDRDGVLNEHRGLISRPEQLQLYPWAAGAVRRINHSEFLAILATNQSVVARNLTDMAGLDAIHRELETALGSEGAKLDDIEFCPHHPDRGYPEENVEYKVECDCRKPKPGMLMRAAQKYNIDLKRSYFIGDSERDHGAALAAGCTFIGVRSGEGNKKGSLNPALLFENLAEAVDFILKAEEFVQNESGKKLPAKPYIIGIGGNSRSGKSTYAQLLKKKYEEAGLKTSVIALDDWILEEGPQRREGDVLHSFQHSVLVKDIEDILRGKPVERKIYQPHPLRSSHKRVYDIDDTEVIIIEGVIALASNELRQHYHRTIFLKTEDEIRKQRFEEFYRWKGKTASQIEELWQLREPEYKLIAASADYADVVI